MPACALVIERDRAAWPKRDPATVETTKEGDPVGSLGFEPQSHWVGFLGVGMSSIFVPQAWSLVSGVIVSSHLIVMCHDGECRNRTDVVLDIRSVVRSRARTHL